MSAPGGGLDPAAQRAAWNDDDPDAVPVELGPWRLELRGDSLSDLRLAGARVLRAVRVVVRDRDWRTARSTEVSADRRGDVLTVRGRSLLADAGVDVAWTLTATAAPGQLRVDLDARALAPFARNRLGLVVLHHPDDAGAALRVRHPDGSTTAASFPVDVAPHQPARDVAGLAWERPGVAVDLELTGDVFEMEDQRNWTDASFKTYSTPLDLPFPVDVPAGARVRQGVVVRGAPLPSPSTGTGAASGTAAASRTAAVTGPGPATGVVRLVPAGHRVPALGGAAPALVEVDLAAPAWGDDLRRAAVTAGDRGLDVRLVTDDPGALRAAARLLLDLPVVRAGVFSATTHVTEPEPAAALVEVLGPRGVEVVAGTRAHFTELNRHHGRLPAGAASWTFSSTPQMHDTARDQVLEALDVQALTARRAVALAGGRPVHVGPVTLRPRFNAVATSPGGATAPPEPDPRELGPACTAWVVASAAALAVPGVTSVTHAPTGGGQPGPGTPLARALVLLARVAGSAALAVEGELPGGVHVLAAELGGTVTVLAANVGALPRTLRCTGAAEASLELPPCAVTTWVSP